MSKIIKKVRKRDGRIADFDQARITNAIFAAAVEVGGRNREIAERLSDEVVKILEEKYAGEIPNVEDIQDVVEKVLIEMGHAKTAKAYILYRKQHEEMRKLKSTFFEVEHIVDDYLGMQDWRVKENSNVGYSLSGLLLHIAGSVIANYTLDRVYPMEVADAHAHGDFHVHDLGMGITGYCAGWSLSQLLAEGFNGVPSKVASRPPAHLDTALLQMVNFIGSLQNEWAGAQAFNSVDTLLAPFVRKDGLDYRQAKQAMQTFVFNLNIASRWGGQTPFTNITLDLTVPEDLASQHVTIGGKLGEKTYEEYTEEMEMINRALIEVMMEGDMNGRPFTFPIPTYSLTKDFEWDNGVSSALFEMTAKYGLPYFQNFINSDLKPSDVRSMCCHLMLDLAELRRNVTGGLFGSGDSTGSVGVVTVNMPRLGYLSKTEDEFFEKLGYIMELARISLEAKRDRVKKNMENGLLPFTKRYLGTLNNHFSTIGLVGMNEACLNLLDCSIAADGGKKFAVKTLKFMLGRIKTFQEETGNIYNLEATPAEGVSYRLAKIDKKKYSDIITAGERAPYYTNSTLLPVNSGLDLITALKHQEELQTLYTGGTVHHIFLGESLEDGESCMNIVRKVSHNTRLPYFTVTPTYTICDDHGFIPGEYPKCPSCGKVTEVYSRVVGYFRPVRNWNVGKQEEFRQRIEYH
ncbi:Anaerobic ribonucleoside-triphosphate reductase [subsurface metagenome]